MNKIYLIDNKTIDTLEYIKETHEYTEYDADNRYEIFKFHNEFGVEYFFHDEIENQILEIEKSIFNAISNINNKSISCTIYTICENIAIIDYPLLGISKLFVYFENDEDAINYKPTIHVIREITDDEEYKDYNLAR